MRPRRIGLTLLALLPAACGGVLYQTSNIMTGRSPDEVFQCTEEQFKVLGYRRMARDVTDRRLLGERFDPQVRAPTGLFRRGFHRMEVTIRPDASGTTAMEIKVQTFKEYETQAGQTLEEEKVHASAQLDARRLSEACATGP